MGLGTPKAEGASHPGRVRPSSLWLPELLWPGKAHNAEPAPYRAAGSLSSVDRERSAPPSPQLDETSNLNQRPPPPACVRAEIRH